MMRKRLIILGGIVVLIVIILVTVVRPKVSPPLSLCGEFIVAVQKGDSAGSYALFSEAAKATVTQEEWAGRVSELQAQYGTAKPVLTSDKEKTSLNATDESFQEVYEVIRTSELGESAYVITCYLQKNGDQYVIDGTTSKPRGWAD